MYQLAFRRFVYYQIVWERPLIVEMKMEDLLHLTMQPNIPSENRSKKFFLLKILFIIWNETIYKLENKSKFQVHYLVLMNGMEFVIDVCMVFLTVILNIRTPYRVLLSYNELKINMYFNSSTFFFSSGKKDLWTILTCRCVHHSFWILAWL